MNFIGNYYYTVSYAKFNDQLNLLSSKDEFKLYSILIWLADISSLKLKFIKKRMWL